MVAEPGEVEIADTLNKFTPHQEGLEWNLPPTFDSVEAEREHRKQRLAGALRVFGRCGFGEGVAGHITARDPELTDHFWVNPFGMSFRHVKVSDLILVNHQGDVVHGRRPVNRAAFVIHAAVHAARPDVIAAAHAHSVYGKAWSSLGRPLDPITQDACVFFEDHAVVSDGGGVVVLDVEGGEALARGLGSHKAAIHQNHGLFTVGESVDEAAWWFLTMERSCQAQLLAEAAGADDDPGRGRPVHEGPDRVSVGRLVLVPADVGRDRPHRPGPVRLNRPAAGSAEWWALRYRADTRRRRPRPDGLSVARIMEAALAIVDSDGLDALTMRRVADELGTTHTSLYRHVASRDELLVELVDHVLGEIRSHPPGPRWRGQVEWYAREFRRVLLTHRGLVPLLTAGQLLGPHAMGARDTGIAILLEEGATPEVAVHSYLMMAHFVIGSALLDTAGAARTAAQRAAMARLFAAMPLDDYPVVRENAEILNAPDGDAEFDFGLDILLDGIERHLGVCAQEA